METDPTLDMTPLAELIPGVAALNGLPGPDQLGGPLCRYLAGHERLTWTEVARMSPSEIARVSNVGPIRTKKVLTAVSALVANAGAARQHLESSAESSPRGQATDVLAGIAAWAVGTGVGGSVLDAVRAAMASGEVDAPRVELERLGSIPAEKLADPDLVLRYDPVLAAEQLLAAFNDRERATLERILDFDGSAPTLQELGEQFSVTRERIRQVETKVKQRLAASLTDVRYTALVAAADRLRDRLGSAIPSDDLVGEFAEYPPDLLDRLILHLAGPYRFDGDWYVLDSLGSFDAAVGSAFDSAATDGIAPLDAYRDALSELGVRDEYLERAITGDRRLRVVGDDVVEWTGSLSTKAVLALRRAGTPLLFDELVQFVGPNSERGMSNQVHADERIVKVGVSRFALAEWNMDTFEGVVPTMITRLQTGPREVTALGQELAEEFGVSPNSVGILATQHPAFLVEHGSVMLRPEDRPYEPFTDLVRTRNCYVIDGVWSWRVPVDRDVLRGSGRALPEAFAVHLGATPLESGTLDSPVGPVMLSWRQFPSIGSMRSLARSLDAEEGDWMFVRRISPSAIDAVLLRAGDVPAEPDRAVRALVGAVGSTGELEKVLADALGLRGTVNHDLSEEREVLVERREHDLVELLDGIR
jgi:hypothetical protein